MRRKALSLALALFLALSLLPAAALAAEDQPERGVIRYSETVAPQYEDAQLFCEGLAAVKKDGKWGYIDTDGKVVIPFQYDQAYHFNEGKAVVGTLNGQDTQGRWYIRAGFIDKAGKYTPFQTTDGLAVYYEADTREVADEFEYVFQSGYIPLPVVLYDGANALFDASGKEVELVYEFEGIRFTTEPVGRPVNEGLVPVIHGYYDLASYRVISLEQNEDVVAYAWNSFNQGLAPVWFAQWDEQLEEYSYVLGFVNTSGEWSIEPSPVQTFWINNPETICETFGPTGLAMLKNGEGLWGAIDKTGKTVIPFRYEGLGIVGDGLIRFQENGKHGYLDAATLETVIPARYEETTGFSNGLAAVYDGSKAILIDRRGNPVPGGDKLRVSTYFFFKDSGSTAVQPPAEYVVIEENGRYGYGHVEYLPPLPEKDEMSDWAYEEVTAAIEENLVPVALQNLYQNNINRGEFCGLTVQAVTEILGVSAEELVQQRTGKALSAWIGEYPFRDTADADVIAAYTLDIVGGRGNGTFDPYATITRQEAAALLTRGAKVLGMDTTVITEAGYADGGDIAGWAKGSVDFVAQANVMNGTGEGRFTPAGTYSREQSFMTIYRLYQALLETQK